MKPGVVSIIVVSHDRPEFLRKALESIRDQDDPNWEPVVVDASHNPLEQVVQEVMDGKCKYKYLPGMAEWPPRCSEKWNYGVSLSEGEYVAFLDDDDLKTLDMVRTVKKILDKNLDTAYVVHRAWVINSEGERTGPFMGRPHNDCEALKKGLVSFIVTGQIVVRRKVFDEIGKFDERLHVAEDYDFSIRLFSRIGIVISNILHLHRKHENQASKGAEVVEETQRALSYIIEKHGLGEVKCWKCGNRNREEMMVQLQPSGWTYACIYGGCKDEQGHSIL